MHRRTTTAIALGSTLLAWMLSGGAAGAAPVGYTLIGWNDLGMHCMDADYSVFSILPPYNTIHAQLIDADGQLVTNPAGITVTYEAVPIPPARSTRTSVGKTNFWDHVASLFGVSPPVDEGLAGYAMPGSANQPQSMTCRCGPALVQRRGHADHTLRRRRQRQLLPDDAPGGARRLGRDPRDHRHRAAGVRRDGLPRLPRFGELGPAARPLDGWVNDPDPERDYRLNILRLHDDHRAASSSFQAAADAGGLRPAGARGDASPAAPRSCAPPATPPTPSPAPGSRASRR